MDAVIRTHERIRSSLRLLTRGEAVPVAAEASRDARIIDEYSQRNGVDPASRSEVHLAPRRLSARWLAG